jgi:hypothetical protein
MSKTKTKPAPKIDPKKLAELNAMEKRLAEMQAQLEKKGVDKKKQDEILGPLRKQIEDRKKKLNVKTIVGDGEVIVAGEPIIVEEPLGPLRWGGKYRGDFWALANTKGEVVRSGGGGLSNDLARINGLGTRALAAIADLETLDGKWRSESSVVRKATDQGATDVKALVKAKPAISKRNEKEDDFLGDVNGFLTALKDAEEKTKQIRKAEHDLDEAVELLNAAVYAFEFNEEEKKVKRTEDEIKKLNDEIAQAKSIFKNVMEIATKVAKQDWEGLATKAISAYADAVIDAAYAQQLDELKKQLSEAKKKMGQLKEKELVSRINAAHSKLESATVALDIAQSNLAKFLENFKKIQRNARNELNKSEDTKIAGKMIDDRTKQLNSIAAARATCRKYLNDSKRVAKAMSLISDQYSQVGTFLDKAVKIDPAFDQNKPYGKKVYLLSIKNAVSLGNWSAWVSGVQSECSKALQFFDQQGDKGPMGPFDQAIKELHSALE